MIRVPGPLSPLEKMKREIPIFQPSEKSPCPLFVEAKAIPPDIEAALSDIESYCFFIGYPRSGHSLVGSLLDAHPEIIISHELDALQFMLAGYDKKQLCHLMIENSRISAKHNRSWGEYEYGVPISWQGKFKKLTVLGDKKGGETTMKLVRDPNLLEKITELFGGKVKFIHVVRNPFDIITTLFRKSQLSPQQCLDWFCQAALANDAVRKQVGEDSFIDIEHEEFVANPKDELKKICNFLGRATDEAYLDACASIVFDKPKSTRKNIHWEPETIKKIEGFFRQYDFLKKYKYS